MAGAVQRARSASGDGRLYLQSAKRHTAPRVACHMCKSMQFKIWTSARQLHVFKFSLFNFSRSRYNKARAASCCITHALLKFLIGGELGSRPRKTSKGVIYCLTL